MQELETQSTLTRSLFLALLVSVISVSVSLVWARSLHPVEAGQVERRWVALSLCSTFQTYSTIYILPSNLPIKIEEGIEACVKVHLSCKLQVLQACVSTLLLATSSMQGWSLRIPRPSRQAPFLSRPLS